MMTLATASAQVGRSGPQYYYGYGYPYQGYNYYGYYGDSFGGTQFGGAVPFTGYALPAPYAGGQWYGVAPY
jgi:hypothetical protein